MRGVRLVLSLLCLLWWCPGALGAQEEQPDAAAAETRIVAHERGRVALDGRELPLAVALSPRGPLFELEPLVRLLGGTLQSGPLGQSHVLKIGGQEAVLGAGSPVLVLGQQIISLTQAPLGGTSGIQVPLDALERTFGEAYGYQFDWQDSDRLLRVGSASTDALPVEFDWVHSQGITTLLLKFPHRPRFEVSREAASVRVRGLGQALQAAVVPPRITDPLLRAISVDGGSVVVSLHPGAAAAEPYELQRDDRFELVFEIAREQAVAAAGGGAPSLRRPLGGGGAKIVVDPGHGGAEHGAIGKSGTEEKDLTLLLARSFKARLERRLPVSVVLTRDEDVDLPIDVRTAIANQHQADLFLSIHLNAEPWGAGAHGTETYFLSKEASDALAAEAAAVENQGAPGAGAGEAGEGEAGPDGGSPFALQLVLWDLAQNHHLAQSQSLAMLIQEELNTTLDLKDRGVKQAPFRVLMGATMPAVLVELGFLSNPEEERRLQDAEYRQRLIDALVEAVVRFRTAAQDVAAER